MGIEYGNDSIGMLIGSEAIRRKPEVYLTYRTKEGALHTIKEILGNGTDEVTAGYGDEIDVTLHRDMSVTIRDFGRGVPMGWNKKYEMYNWDIIYNKSFGGAKLSDNIPQDIYDAIDVNNPESFKVFAYLFPIGTNGLGGFATQATSEFFEVHSYHNEIHGDTSTPMVCSSMRFEKGYPVYDELHVEPTNEPRGTEVHWKPDCEEVFADCTDDILDINWIKQMCEEVAYLQGFTIKLYDENTDKEYDIKGTTQEELFKIRMNGNEISDNMLVKEVWTKGVQGSGKTAKRYLAKANINIAFTTKAVRVKCYHNTSSIARGVTYSAVNMAFSTFFSRIMKKEGVNERVQDSDYTPYISAFIATYSTTTSFEGQTKQGVQNQFLFDLVYTAITNMLFTEYSKENKDLKNIIGRIKSDIDTRVQIREYSKQVKDAKKATKKRKVEKLTECSSNDPEICELWIPEGDSAALCCEKARSKVFQAILPIRGKILNVVKASMDKILKCDPITNIFSVLGVDMDLPGTDLFNIKKLKYKKIIIATDADEDGYQIRVLVFLVFWRLAPKLLRDGYVYIAETPLFTNILNNGTKHYCYTQEEQDEFYAKNKERITRVIRSKGLGENNPDMLWETTMCPETRRLIQLKIDPDDKDCQQIVECMFGNDKYRQRKPILLKELGNEISEIFSTVDTTEEMDITA